MISNIYAILHIVEMKVIYGFYRVLFVQVSKSLYQLNSTGAPSSLCGWTVGFLLTRLIRTKQLLVTAETAMFLKRQDMTKKDIRDQSVHSCFIQFVTIAKSLFTFAAMVSTNARLWPLRKKG